MRVAWKACIGFPCPASCTEILSLACVCSRSPKTGARWLCLPYLVRSTNTGAYWLYVQEASSGYLEVQVASSGYLEVQVASQAVGIRRYKRQAVGTAAGCWCLEAWSFRDRSWFLHAVPTPHWPHPLCWIVCIMHADWPFWSFENQ